MKLYNSNLTIAFLMFLIGASALRFFSIPAKFNRSISSSIPLKASPKDMTVNAIRDNQIMVFSKSYCPYCTKAKGALDELKLKYTVYELDKMDEGSAIQAELQTISGQKTVPNIFVKGKHVGGCDATLAKIKTGEFQKMLT